jgi:hypothetical protein
LGGGFVQFVLYVVKVVRLSWQQPFVSLFFVLVDVLLLQIPDLLISLENHLFVNPNLLVDIPLNPKVRLGQLLGLLECLHHLYQLLLKPVVVFSQNLNLLCV